MNRHLLTVSRAIHVYLSLALLLVLVFFALTGITLNHAARLSPEPAVSTMEIDTLPDLPRDAQDRIIASPELARYARDNFGVRLELATLQYEDEFLIIDYQAPGKAVVLEVDQAANAAFAESTDFGLVALLNDLHKGRHVDVLWSWLIDLSGVLLVLFSLAGLMLLLPNKRRLRTVMLYSVIGCSVLAAGYWLGNL